MSKVVLIFMNILVVVGYFLDLFQADLELVILRHKDEKSQRDKVTLPPLLFQIFFLLWL